MFFQGNYFSCPNCDKIIVLNQSKMKKSIRGKVVPGRGLGSKMGFPTINILYEGDASGIFAGEVLFNDKKYRAAVHVGVKPTFDDQVKTVEAHLIDFDGNIDNGEEISVILLQRIRGSKKFENLESLKKQISEDVMEIRNYFVV